MVSQRGVKANPYKIQTVLEMTPPKNVKEVQSLNGRVAALNRFISRAIDKCLWIDECQKAFEELKEYLAAPPLLSPSKPSEELSLYLVVSLTVISSTLIREKDHIHLPIYYSSRALLERKEGITP